MISFFVPGQPVGKARPRVARHGGFSRLYTPEKTASYESRVAMAGHIAMRDCSVIDGPVSVRMEITVQIPASWSKKKHAAALAGQVLPTTKPDIDNVEKAIFDALNNVVWRDDVQVVEVSKRKRYGLTPGVSVSISHAVLQLLEAA